MQRNQLVFDAIGTHWQIVYTSSHSSEENSTLFTQMQRRIDSFDRVYSRFRADSLITKISQKKGIYDLPSDAGLLFTQYKKLYDLTNGVFTPLVGLLLADAGYDSSYSLQPKRLRKVPRWDKVLAYDAGKLIVKKPVLLDFGAGGKGYLIDLIGNILKRKGIADFFINAGGDIVAHTKKPLRVGLENPKNTAEVIGVAKISNESICGSAGNRRVWENFHHIMYPGLKKSVSHILATWVIAENGLLADSLSTCLFFSPPKILLKEFHFSYAIVYEDLSLEVSKDFSAEFYS